MIAALVSLLLALGAPASGSTAAPASATTAPAGTTPFAPTSVWNAPLAGSAPLDSGSARLVSALMDQKSSYRAWINTTRYSTPIYRVPAGQPTVPVWIDHPPSVNATTLEAQTSHVPIPAGARPSRDLDSRMVVWQTSTDTMWEFWRMRWQSLPPEIGWHAGWGAVIPQVSQSSGVNPRPFGATGSGLALMGGLITLDDVRRGSIDHALALGVPRVTRNVVVAPANRTDGKYTGASSIPEGTRFRLNPSVNVEALGLPPAAREIALAVQRYGMIVRDGSGSVTLYAEDPTPSGSNPYPAWLGGQSPAQVLRRFPWDRLQVMRPPSR
jgi:hypothetical protein